MRRAHLIYGVLCLGNHLFIIYSNPPRPTVPRLNPLNWMYNFASDINNFIPALILATCVLSSLLRFDSCTDVGYSISAQVFRRPLLLSPTSIGP